MHDDLVERNQILDDDGPRRDDIMTSIEGCSPKRPFPSWSKSDDQPGNKKNSNALNSEEGPSIENHIPAILAKAAVSAKIISGIGNSPRGKKAAPACDGCEKDEMGGGRGEPIKNDMIRNLAAITKNKERWNLFALGAMGLQPEAKSSATLRICLLKDLSKGNWDDISGFSRLYPRKDADDENGDHRTSAEGLSAGLRERIRLWLCYPEYFESLLVAVQEKKLPQEISLYTSDHLVQYLRTIS